MRWVKRAAWILGGLVLVLVLAVGGALAWLNSRPGQAWLQAMANQSLAGEARLTGLSGAPPFHLTVDGIDLVDDHGVWARLQGVHLDIAPWDLLRARLTIERLSAAVVDMQRPPVPRAQTTSSSSTLIPPGGVDLEKLSLASVRLPPDIFGEPTTWAVTAAASLIGSDAELTLHIHEHDPSPMRIDGRFALADERANASAVIDDPRGLLARRATGQALPLRAELTGDGTGMQHPGDWQGRLDAALGAKAHLEAALHLAAHPGAREFETDGELDGASLLPAKLSALIEPTLRFHLAARDVLGTGWSVDGLTLRSAAATVEGTGTYRTRNRAVDASLHLQLPDLARLSTVAGASTAGSIDAVLVSKGPLDRLQAHIDAHGAHIVYAANAIDDMAVRIAAGRAPDGYHVAGGGTLSGVRSAGAPLPAGLGEAVHWTLNGTADPALQTIRVGSVSLSSAGLTLTGNGSFDRSSQFVAGAVQVAAADLHDFAELAPGLRGHARVAATMDGTLSGPAHIHVQGGLDDFATGIPAADQLIGGRLQLDTDLSRDAHGLLNLAQATVRGAAMNVTAHGNLNPATRDVRADFTVAIENLAVLQRAGLPAGGRVAVTGHVAGPPSALAMDAHVDGTALRWQSARVDRAKLDLRASSEGAPAGHLTGELRSRDITVGLAADASLSSDRKSLTISRLRVASGRDVIAARLKTALDSLMTSGQVTAALPDLRRLSPLAGMELGGRLNLKLALSPAQGQTAEAALAATDLSAAPPAAAPIRAQHIQAKGRLVGLLHRPSGRFELTGDNLSAAGASIRTMRVSASAPRPDRVDVTGDIEGDFKGPFALTAGANVIRTRDATRLTVQRLTGRVAGTPLRLQQPLVVTARSTALAMAGLKLAIGDGVISGEARRDVASLNLDLDAEHLPVGLAGHFAGRDDLAGSVSARIQIAGPAAQPRGRIEITGDNLRVTTVAPGTPALTVAADAALAARQINIDAHAQAGSTKLLFLTGIVPVSFGPQPGMASLSKDRPLHVNIRSSCELAQITDLLPLAGDRLAGHLDVAADVTGTAAKPLVRGDVSIAHGHFEDMESGLLIDALDVDLGADGNNLVLRHLSATDGAKGRISGSGTASLGGGTASTLTVSLNKFQALRRSDASLTASGSATIAGKLTAPVLVARLTVDRAEFFIPNPPPPSAAKIPVTVIDSSTGTVLSQPKQAAAPSGSGAITLDVAVRIPGNTFVRGRGLDSEWRGDVRARGSSSAPDVTGALQIVHGTFSFFGKDLTLTRGTVTFTGGHKISPNIDVLAETTTSEATFDVGATGTPDNLKIKLSSTPGMPQDEILSHLIFGRDVTSLSPAEGLQIAQAAATLSSGGPGLLDNVRHKLGLDVLNVGSMNNSNGLQPVQPQRSSGSSATDNTGISAGKYVASGVYVGAQQGLNGETRSQVQVEVLPRLRVESSAGTRSEEFGVNWQMDY